MNGSAVVRRADAANARSGWIVAPVFDRNDRGGMVQLEAVDEAMLQ